MERIRVATLISASILAFACAGGSTLPSDPTKAVIRAAPYVSITEVNGERPRDRAQFLIPGNHRFRVFSEARPVARMPRLPPGAIGVDTISVDCEVSISLRAGDHALISRTRHRNPEQLQLQVTGSVSREIVEGANCRGYCLTEKREDGSFIHNVKLCSEFAKEGVESQPPIVALP